MRMNEPRLLSAVLHLLRCYPEILRRCIRHWADVASRLCFGTSRYITIIMKGGCQLDLQVNYSDHDQALTMPDGPRATCGDDGL